jgi:HK97 gp10 family phage protein
VRDTVHVKGLSKLNEQMEKLPGKLQANVLRGALRDAAKVVLEEAKSNVPVNTGTLRDGLKISTSIRNGTVTAKVKTTGKHAYLARWLEFGTRAHKIYAKIAKTLALRPNARASTGSAKRWTTHDFADSVDHPGIQPRPFMRPALDSKAGQALLAAGEYIKKRLASKHGLDTQEINLELGDDDEG